MSIHSQNEQVILEFGLHKPAFRIVVNSPTTHGSVGLSTGLDPAMTLGCGGYGGNITSDNISPRHLLNIKRLAYEVSPVVSRWDRLGGGVRTETRRPRAHAAVRQSPAALGTRADAAACRHQRGCADPADRRVPRVAGIQGSDGESRLRARPRERAAARLRLRRRCPAGHSGGTHTRRLRARDRHARGARPRRAASRLHASRPGRWRSTSRRNC